MCAADAGEAVKKNRKLPPFEDVMEWSGTDVTVTIGGEPIVFDSASFTERTTKLCEDLKGAFYAASTSIEITAEAFRNLLNALNPRYLGASDLTLARRVFYGGRKGRSALRRLFVRGYGAVAMTDAGPMLVPDEARWGSLDRGEEQETKR